MGHDTSSTWNHATACKAHEIGDPLHVFEIHLCSALQGISAEPHSAPPLIRLHILSLSQSSLVVNYKCFALKYWRMPWCHIWVLIYLLSLTLGLVELDIKPGQPLVSVRTILFPPSISPLVWCCITLFTSNAHSSNETSPFLVETPLNVLNFSILPTTSKATLGQVLLHHGSGICLGNCIFATYTDTISSLPPYVIQCGNITSNIYTVTQPHLSGSQCITYIFIVYTFCKDKQSVIFIMCLLPLAPWSYAHRLSQWWCWNLWTLGTALVPSVILL